LEDAKENFVQLSTTAAERMRRSHLSMREKVQCDSKPEEQTWDTASALDAAYSSRDWSLS
jgi:hypothetical protein